MRRIIHASTFSWKPKGAFQHGTPHKISNGLIRNGHHVINFCDRDVARALSPFGHRTWGRGRMNEVFYDLCRSTEPDGIILGHADLITKQTVDEIRRALPDVRVLQWNVDPLFDDPNVRRLQNMATVVDATLVSTAGDPLMALKRNDNVVGFLPNPTDSSIERGTAYQADKSEIDLLYVVGNSKDLRYYCGQMWNVEELGQTISKQIPELVPGFFGMFGKANVLGGAYQRILESSKMGLNVSKRNDFYLYSSDRLAQMMGNGLLTFVDRATGLHEIIPEDAAVFHDNVGDLVDRLRFFKHNDSSRRDVARRGAMHYRSVFNERIVARYLVEVMFNDLSRDEYPWPTLVA